MDKEVRLCKEELEATNKCVILLFFDTNTTMTVFMDNGEIFKDIFLGTSDDNKYRVMINMRKFFRQGA